MRNRNNRKVEVILPRMGKFKGTQCVYYSVFNPCTDRMERYRIHRGFKACADEKEQTRLASKIIKEYTLKLRAGWRPWADDAVIYSDETEYHSIAGILGTRRQDGSHIRRHISKFIEEKRLSVSKKSMESYVSKLRIFVLWLEKNDLIDRRVYEISDDIINQFITYLIQDRQLDRLSIEKYQQNLNQFFKYCINRKLIDRLPTTSIPKPPKRQDMAARPIADSGLRREKELVGRTVPGSSNTRSTGTVYRSHRTHREWLICRLFSATANSYPAFHPYLFGPQREPAFKLSSVQPELQQSVFDGTGHVAMPIERRVGAAVPYFNRAGTVIAIGYRSFGITVVVRMILDVHSQSFVLRIHRQPLGYGPTFQDAVGFQAEIPMQVSGVVFLYDKNRFFAG